MKNDKVLKILKAVSNPVRFKIVIGLMENECNVTKMQEKLGLSQPLVSHHLKILRECGLIVEKQIGKQRCYYIKNNNVRELIEFILKKFN